MLNKDLIALNLINGLGSSRIRKLLDYFHSADKILQASADELSQVEGIGVNLARSIVEERRKVNLGEELKLIEENKINIFTFLDEEYPSILKKIYDPPIVLYVKGDFLNADDLALAIVGSRRASFYGLSTAEQLASQLAGLGVTIVSGLARGIDTAAHKGALKARGRTIAVLGSGLGNIYPDENKALAEEISQNGAVISEFGFNTPPVPGNFPCRNRIISGLSLGVIIVEAAKRSGALITADCALEQGREVFAVPGKFGSDNSFGANKLIQQGAKLIQGIEDIFEELNLNLGNRKETPVKAGKDISLAEQEDNLFGLISDEPINIDNLIDKSGSSVQEVARILLKLQLRHLIKELPGKNYVRGLHGS